MWRQRTGVDSSLEFRWLGQSTASNDTCENNDGVNQIYVVDGCRDGDPPPCTTYGESKRYPNASGGPLTEADVCIYGGAAGPTGWLCTDGWTIRSDGVLPNEKDLIGTLVHESGHAIGLGHEVGSVMQADTYNCGNAWSRYPTGDDVDGIRSIYGFGAQGIPSAYWRGRNQYFPLWTSEVAQPDMDGVWPLAAAVGGTESGAKMVVAELSDHGDVIAFNRANQPITPWSSWTAPSFAIDTWLPPAIAARPSAFPHGELWVAAVSQVKQVTMACNEIRVLSSIDNFSNITSTGLFQDGACGSLHEPGIAYDPASNRFALFFVSHATQSPGDWGKIFATTSEDGVNWTTPQEFGLYTIDGVGVACAEAAQDECIMAYSRASSNDSTIVNRSFTIDASGVITVSGNYSLSSSWSQGTPAVAVYDTTWPQYFLLAAPEQWSVTDRANGDFNLRYAESLYAPLTSYTPWDVATTSLWRGALASSNLDQDQYLWYVR
jgi:hypothetical protein